MVDEGQIEACGRSSWALLPGDEGGRERGRLQKTVHPWGQSTPRPTPSA